MIVNGKEYNIEDLVKTIDTSKMNMVKVGSFYLTKEEISILERNFIDYKNANSLKDLIMKIQNVFEDEELDPDDGDELDYVLDSISERDYYQNTNK